MIAGLRPSSSSGKTPTHLACSSELVNLGIEVPPHLIELRGNRLNTAFEDRNLGVLRFDLSVAVALFSSTLVERLLELRDKGLLVLELVLDIAELSLAFGAHLLYLILGLLGRTLKRLHLRGAFSESTLGRPS